MLSNDIGGSGMKLGLSLPTLIVDLGNVNPYLPD
jgi:hypothetical protein